MTRPIPEPNPLSRGQFAGPRPIPWPRFLNAALGAWLSLSAFLWFHADSSRTNTWVVGLLMVGAGLWAASAPAVRWFNTVLAVWLALTTLAMVEIRPGTFWNNLVMAIAAFAVSLIPSPSERRAR